MYILTGASFITLAIIYEIIQYMYYMIYEKYFVYSGEKTSVCRDCWRGGLCFVSEYC